MNDLREYQTLLDTENLMMGDIVPKPGGATALGNGSVEMPLLTPVGVDRHGRLWAEYPDRFVLLFTNMVFPPNGGRDV